MSAEDSVDQSSIDMDKLAKRLAQEISKQSGGELLSKTPHEAVDKYFEIRDLKKGTERTHRSSLYNFFVQWCEDVADITDMRELTGDDLAGYRVWRRDVASTRVKKLSPKTEQSQQRITRTFIKHCESFNAVPSRLHEYVLVPSLDAKDEVRNEVLDSNTARDILEYLRKYEYASLQHIVLLLFGASGMRVSDLHSLDRTDYATNNDGTYLKLRHRPAQGTTLKNEENGERTVSVTDSVKSILDDYIEDQRIHVTDEYGRNPLLSTDHGRLAQSTMRNYVYAWTRPCAIGKSCPYDESPDDCKAARRNNWAHKCPDSLSCHPIRKGYITQELKAGVPLDIVSERCDVSEPVLKKHYDFRTDQEKMAARRIAFELAHKDNPGYGE